MAETGKEEKEGVEVCLRTPSDGDTVVTIGESPHNNNLRENVNQAAVAMAVAVITEKETIESRKEGKGEDSRSPRGTEGPSGHTRDGASEPVETDRRGDDEIESVRRSSEELLTVTMPDGDCANTAEGRLTSETRFFSEMEEILDAEEEAPPLPRLAPPRPGAEHMIGIAPGVCPARHMRRLGRRTSVILSPTISAASASSYALRRRSSSLPHIQGATLAPCERGQGDTWRSLENETIRQMAREAPVVEGMAINTDGRLNSSTWSSLWKNQLFCKRVLFGGKGIFLMILIGIAFGASLAVTTPKRRPAPKMTRFEVIKQMVTQVSNEQSLSNTTLPQYLALDWITNEKTLPLLLNDFSSSLIVQRYTVALIYFSMKGEHWSNSSLFLSDSHECNWYGISCDGGESPNAVQGITMGELRGMI